MPPGDRDENAWQLYEERLSQLPRWKNRKEEIKQELLGETDDTENVIEERFESSIETAEDHNDLVRTVCTAFGPRSTIYNESGWRLAGIEPLHELDPSLRNPDVIIGNPDREMLVTVECKSGLSSPQNTLTQIREAAETVLDHREYLAEQAGCEFSRIERVLCIPGPIADTAVRAIEQEENETDPSEPILLWKVFRFDEETIQLHTNFSTRTPTESAHDNQLAQLLDEEGAPTADQPRVTPEVFLESHPFVTMDSIFSEVLYRREIGDGSIQKFTRDEVFRYLNDQEILPHYATQQVADDICDNLLETMKDLGLIEETDSGDGMADGLETYEYATSRRSSSNILNALRSQYRNEWIERRAEREAREAVVEEFNDEHTSLEDFVEPED